MSWWARTTSALFWAAIAGYNAGPGNVRKALEAGADPDSVTTGRDYSKDVKARARAFKEVLGEPPPAHKRLSVCHFLAHPPAGLVHGLVLPRGASPMCSWGPTSSPASWATGSDPARGARTRTRWWPSCRPFRSIIAADHLSRGESRMTSFLLSPVGKYVALGLLLALVIWRLSGERMRGPAGPGTGQGCGNDPGGER